MLDVKIKSSGRNNICEHICLFVTSACAATKIITPDTSTTTEAYFWFWLKLIGQPLQIVQPCMRFRIHSASTSTISVNNHLLLHNTLHIHKHWIYNSWRGTFLKTLCNVWIEPWCLLLNIIIIIKAKLMLPFREFLVIYDAEESQKKSNALSQRSSLLLLLCITAWWVVT